MVTTTNIGQLQSARAAKPSRLAHGQRPAPPQPDSLPRPTDTTGVSAPVCKAAPTVPVEREDELQELAAELQQALAAALPEQRTVRFRWAKEHNLFILEVRSASTGELVKQYPPEKILNMRRQLDELLGVIIDQQV